MGRNIERRRREVFDDREIRRMSLDRVNLSRKLLAKKDIEVSSITYWEELVCVGFNPDLEQLEAVVSIKRSSGYLSDLCGKGSKEYVRFFVDWGDGNGFQDVGLTSFKVHDIPEAPAGPQHPIHYMVYLELDEEDKRKCCDVPVLPRVRAILEWNKIPPLDPDHVPYYGNVLDSGVQIKPLDTSIRCLIKAELLEIDSILLDSIDLDAVIPKPKPEPVIQYSKLAPKYKKHDVPDHRFVYQAVYPLVKGGETLEYFTAQIDEKKLEELEIDLDYVVDVLSEDEANVSYEELVCVGLNPTSDTLGAVIHVKNPYGYSGNLCQNGSQEYVAFWADWNNNGVFDEYLGRAQVTVHDIDEIPAEGLFYSVMLPVNLQKHLKECENPNIIRIRGVLSWSIPPSETDPDDLNYWGNRRDVLVQIRSGIGTSELIELLYDVGNVPIDDISPVTFLAHPSTGILDPSDCHAPKRDRPFGGMVRVGGRIYNTGPPKSVYYKVEYSPHGANDWKPVTHTHRYELMHPNPFDPKHPKEKLTLHSADGWFPYLEEPLAMPPILERTSCLARWQTGSLEGEYDIRLAYTEDYPITISSIIHHSEIVTIVLDNTNYTVSPTPNMTVDTSYKQDIVIDGGDCHSYKKGETIKGHLRALDKHFWKWTLEIQPTTHTHGTQASPRCRSYSSLTDTGDGNAAWSLDTSKLDKCGYTITLWARDRTIVNSNGALHHWNKKAVGFSIV